MDIANIVGRQIDVLQAKRAAGILVDIGDRSVRDLEAVYFEGIDLLKGIRLSAERDLVGALSAKLREVDVNFGTREPKVRHHAHRKEFTPLDSRAQDRKQDY